jgi:hypothetical protein
MTRVEPLSPLAAYDLSTAQKARLSDDHLTRIMSIYQRAVSFPSTELGGGVSGAAFVAAVAKRRQLRPDLSLAKVVSFGYRDLALTHGLRRIDPVSPGFEADLGLFFRHYRANFPIVAEQESLNGFRTVLFRPPSDSGYEERCYSVVCPLTGEYLMGFDFTIQPMSDTVHFIYGFVMPKVRGGWGFGGGMISAMRDIAQAALLAFFQSPGARSPPKYHDPSGPLVLFEKNRTAGMTLTDIMLDAAKVDIFHPPDTDADLAMSAMGQSLRDGTWDRLGGRIVHYNYQQPSLDGITVVPESQRDHVIRLLNGGALPPEVMRTAQETLRAALPAGTPGCSTLDLCVFARPGATSVPATQIHDSVKIFHANSVVKTGMIETDIWFQAQAQSLAEQTSDGRLALKRIPAVGADPGNFTAAEERTRRLLASVTWDDLCRAADRPYAEWLTRSPDSAGG